MKKRFDEVTNHLHEFGKLLVFLYVIAGVGQELRRPADNVNSGNPRVDLRSLQEALDQALEKSRVFLPSRQASVGSVAPSTDLLANHSKSMLLEPRPTKPSPDGQTIEAINWLRLIPHPSIVIILGKRGAGKSALGYRLLELFRWVANCYVVGLPKDARKYLPDWIGMATSLEDVPPKSVVLVDEAYMPYHARSSMAAEAKTMSQLVNLSRQREQTLVFVTQEARQVDRNIASSANVVIFKDLGILQLEFDRRELNKIAADAHQAFATLSGDKRKRSYVYSPDSNFMGLAENHLPTFWKEKLSHIFSTGGDIMARAPKKPSLTERVETVNKYKQQGLSLGQTAKLMGVSKATIKNYLEGYPYKK